MKNKILIAIFILAGLGLIPEVIAMATTVNVGGGIWDYGTTVGGVHSNYYHRTVRHGSTSCVAADCISQTVAKDKTSYTGKNKSILSTAKMQAFWHNN